MKCFLIAAACLSLSVMLLANEPEVLERIPEEFTRKCFGFGSIHD